MNAHQNGMQNGAMAAGYTGIVNGHPSSNHHQAYSNGVNGFSQGGSYTPGHRTGASIAHANGMVSDGVQNVDPSARVRHKRPDTEEIKRVAHVHYEELFKFLKSHLAKGEFKD